MKIYEKRKNPVKNDEEQPEKQGEIKKVLKTLLMPSI